MDQNLKQFVASQPRVHRKRAGLNQAALAEAIGRTSEAVSNIERAKSLPALDTLVAISEALHVPLSTFCPANNFADEKTPNRARLEGEIAAVVSALSDERARIALGHIKALSEK